VSTTLDAIHRCQRVIEDWEHDLFSLIILKRIEDGRQARFSFKNKWYRVDIIERKVFVRRAYGGDAVMETDMRELNIIKDGYHASC